MNKNDKQRLELEQSLLTLEQEAKNAPNNVDILINLGAVALTLSKFDQAKVSFEKACELTPSDPEIHNFLGTVHFYCGDAHSATNCYQKALLLDNANYNAHLNLAEINSSLGSYDTAMNYYNNALKYYPENTDLLIAASRMAVRLQGYDLASNLMSRVIEIDTDHPYAATALEQIKLLENKTLSSPYAYLGYSLDTERSITYALLQKYMKVWSSFTGKSNPSTLIIGTDHILFDKLHDLSQLGYAINAVAGEGNIPFSEANGIPFENIDPDNFDLVILGSLSDNEELKVIKMIEEQWGEKRKGRHLPILRISMLRDIFLGARTRFDIQFAMKHDVDKLISLTLLESFSPREGIILEFSPFLESVSIFLGLIEHERPSLRKIELIDIWKPLSNGEQDSLNEKDVEQDKFYPTLTNHRLQRIVRIHHGDIPDFLSSLWTEIYQRGNIGVVDCSISFVYISLTDNLELKTMLSHIVPKLKENGLILINNSCTVTDQMMHKEILSDFHLHDCQMSPELYLLWNQTDALFLSHL